jgi:aspartate/methionine/tyrosine aminotransferase
MSLDPQAVALNAIIKQANPGAYRLLSRRGRGIFFPAKGIISQSAEARGVRINATVGTAFEDDGSPMCLQAMRRQLTLPPANAVLYAPPLGRPELRDAWEKALFLKNPSLQGVSVSKPVVTCALTHGLSMAGYLFVDEGDTIILPDLYWENYRLVFGNACGAKFAYYPAFAKDGGYNTEGLRRRLMAGKKGKRIVLLNFPNNPTGYTVTEAEAGRLREILVEAADAGNDLLVLVDDAYFGLVFEPGIFRESMFGLLAPAHERLLAVKFDGPTKEDYVWGLRVGFVTFGCARNSAALYDALVQKLAGAIRGNVSNVSNLSQSLLAEAYRDPTYQSQRDEKFAVLKRRCGTVREILAAHPEYAEVATALPFNSGYFMCLKLQPGVDGEALRRRLIEHYGIGVIVQGSVVRIAFSQTPIGSLPTLFDGVYRAGLDVMKK